MTTLFRAILILLGIPLLSDFHSVSANTVAVSGHFNQHRQSLTASATYQYPNSSEIPKYFHLPPNWYHITDGRTQYLINTVSDGVRQISRSQLDLLKAPEYQNLHLPRQIRIISITLNGQPIDYQLLDNQWLNPTLNQKNGLLQLDLKNISPNQKGAHQLIIHFETGFNKLPSTYNLILWNYLPRPVSKQESRFDFSDQLPPLLRVNQKITNSKSKVQTLSEDKYFRIPTLQLSGWKIKTAAFNLSLDGSYSEDHSFIRFRIERVLEFLKREKWIDRQTFFKFTVWDGPLSVAGDIILLPRKTLRYAKIYYKSFEVLVLRGIIRSVVNRGYGLDRFQNSWIQSALYSEVLRDYFQKVYQNDSKYFPWLNWLNPDFIEEISLKPWLTHGYQSEKTDASSSLFLAFDSTLYIPWKEKGFHFFRTILNPKSDPEKRIHTSLKSLFQFQPGLDRRLSKLALFKHFSLSDREVNSSEIWLKDEGKVDYELVNVNLEKNDQNYLISVDVQNNGNLSPGFYLRYHLEDGQTIQHWIGNGSGRYYLRSKEKPVEVEIDPEKHLLEDSRLNNRWQLPIKIRPIWDFPSAESWVFSFFPIINGNAIDQNLMGLSFNLNYLSNTTLMIDAWKSTENDRVLWESTLLHQGFPGIGDVLYLQSSELNASYSNLLGYQHTFLSVDRNLSIEMIIGREKLDHFEQSTVPKEFPEWHTGKMKLTTPFYIGSFVDWLGEFSVAKGMNSINKTYAYEQNSASTQVIWYLQPWKIEAKIFADISQGQVPLQKKFSIGGPEGLPGFPRTIDLLFDQRRILKFGIGLPPFMTHSDINLFRLLWFNRVETSLNTHWGEGRGSDTSEYQNFRDIELRFNISIDWLNLYTSTGVFAIAAPIGSDDYKDYRVVLFSNWVF